MLSSLITFVKSHLLFAANELPLSLPGDPTLREGRLLFVYKLGRIDAERLGDLPYGGKMRIVFVALDAP